MALKNIAKMSYFVLDGT